MAQLTKGVTAVDIVVFPPHPFLYPVFSKIEATNVQLGGQNCFFESEGAYTGAVSTCTTPLPYHLFLMLNTSLITHNIPRYA